MTRTLKITHPQQNSLDDLKYVSVSIACFMISYVYPLLSLSLSFCTFYYYSYGDLFYWCSDQPTAKC